MRGYGLPSWATPEWAVLCSSYSGNTEETLACFAAAEALGARRLVASTGGALVDGARESGVPVIGLPGILPAPRRGRLHARLRERGRGAVGVAPRIHTEIDAAAAFLEQGVRRPAGARRGDRGPARQAPSLWSTGADLTAPVARRWKTQINENAELPAFFSELPEADHNELCGWAGPERQLSAVLLEDSDQHPRERRRFELTAELIKASGAEAVRVETEGETRIARLLWATMLGDLVSLKMAEARASTRCR